MPTPNGGGPPPLVPMVEVRAPSPAQLRALLWLLGYLWDPQPYLPGRPPSRVVGIYLWVAGAVNAAPDTWIHLAAIYAGVGKALDGGTCRRLAAEMGWLHPEAYHRHGRACARLKARPVGGPISPVARSELDVSTWLTAHLAGQPLDEVSRLLAEVTNHERLAEYLLIRGAVHLEGSDAGLILNSAGNSSWDPGSGARAWRRRAVDNLAWAAARELRDARLGPLIRAAPA